MNRSNIAASGKSETYGDIEATSDGAIEEIDAKEKAASTKKEAGEKKVAALKATAIDIRKMLTKRLTESSEKYSESAPAN